jgi:hypothetical protein
MRRKSGHVVELWKTRYRFLGRKLAEGRKKQY